MRPPRPAERAPEARVPVVFGQHRQVFRTRDILLYGPATVLRHVWLQIVLLTGMFGVTALVFHYYQGLRPVAALLASVSTITTIGIYSPAGGVTQLPQVEQLQLLIIFILSVGIFASLIQGAFSQVVHREFWTDEALRREAERMKGHAIVMGYSALGRYAAEKLTELGVPYLVVVREPELVSKLRADQVPAFASSVAEFHKVLETVGVRRASTLICTFEQDPDNLIAILYANKVHPGLRIITTVHDRDLESSARMAGADVVLPTQNILGDLLGLSAISEEVAGVVISARVPAKYIAEFQIPTGSRYTFSELNAVAPVLLVLQGGNILTNPPNDFVVEGGSTIFVLTNPDTIRALREKIRGGREVEAPLP